MEPVENASTYVGKKIVNAVPMTRAEYNHMRGWDVPADENADDEGYLVEYLDGGAPNHRDYNGYISWSPKEQFENAYQDVNAGMDFSSALLMMKRGVGAFRKGWNGKNLVAVLMTGFKLPPYSTSDTARKVNDRTAMWIGADTPLDSQPYFSLSKGDGVWQPGWVPSVGDLLANDWVIVAPGGIGDD